MLRSRLLSHLSLTVMLGLLLGPLSASALTMNVIGLGVDVGDACLSTAASCSAESMFSLTPTVPVTGTFDYTAGLPGNMAIELDLGDISLIGSGPDGVEELLFTGLHISVTIWPTTEVGPTIQGLGNASAILTGSYEQLDGIGGTVVAPAVLNEVISASLLGCPTSGVGQCNISIVARDFQVSVGTANAASHDVQLGMNLLVVPEPTTALLMAIGLGVVGVARRRR